MSRDQMELKALYNYNPETGVFTGLEDGRIIGKLQRPANRYLIAYFNGRSQLLHRLAFLYMTGAFPDHCVDHINGIGTDNRWENLRSVTMRINQQNKARHKNNKSGISGVVWRSDREKWRAKIGFKYIEELGCYFDFFEACCARKSAENRHGYLPNGRR